MILPVEHSFSPPEENWLPVVLPGELNRGFVTWQAVRRAVLILSNFCLRDCAFRAELGPGNLPIVFRQQIFLVGKALIRKWQVCLGKDGTVELRGGLLAEARPNKSWHRAGANRILAPRNSRRPSSLASRKLHEESESLS